MVDVILAPGSGGLALLARRVVGQEHVDPGLWPGPVYLRRLSREDANAAIELIVGEAVARMDAPFAFTFEITNSSNR